MDQRFGPWSTSRVMTPRSCVPLLSSSTHLMRLCAVFWIVNVTFRRSQRSLCVLDGLAVMLFTLNVDSFNESELHVQYSR